MPLQGTTTLLQARAAFQADSVYGGPEGGSLQSGGQFMITEDSIQVVDLLIVRRLYFYTLPPELTSAALHAE